MTSATESYYRYWGKAKKEAGQDGADYHLLVYHCLDVAAVAEVWWEANQSIKSQFMHCLQLSDEKKAKAWVLFFIALHDLGKLDIRFQMKSPETVHKLQKEYFVELKDRNIRYDHGSAGYHWACQEITDYGFDFESEDAALDWIQQVAGHHGSIPEWGELLPPAFVDQKIILQDKNARIAWIYKLADIFLVPNKIQLNDVPKNIPILLAGFCSVCDWIGSSEYFSYVPTKDNNLVAYLNSRKGFALQALTTFGVLSNKLKNSGMLASFPAYQPRGLQTLADQLPSRPGMTIIEAPTGSGKTETALAYASRLLEQNCADCIIFALPTQATANAMLTRLEEVAERWFEKGGNIVLAHGKSQFNQDFVRILARQPDTVQGEQEATIQCTKWLGASKKRAFLGQIGVCTIDQVLLSVLPVRHKFVRSWAVQKSILIVDEVHAYDSYMYGLLGEVLVNQYHAGGSAILLSATLPQYQKSKLLQYWQIKVQPTEKSYPLIIHADELQQVSTYCLPSNTVMPEREIAVETWQTNQLQLSEQQLTKIATIAWENSAKVAVICNLVADAQRISNQLMAISSVPVTLFHSRYRFFDRQQKEDFVKHHYGKSRSVGCSIMVATQVIEQSLDLDFDWIITQICPVDLLFQRLGRLHRHARDLAERPLSFRQPKCVVLVPETTADYGDSKYVYPNLRAMWRTEQLLKEKKIVFSINQSIQKFETAYRSWIERVYQTKAWGDEPAAVEEAYQKFLVDQEVSSLAALQVLKLNTVVFNSDENEKATLLTRDGEMGITVVLVTEKNGLCYDLEGQVFPDSDSWHYWEAISLNSVNVSKRWKDKLPKPNNVGIRFIKLFEETPGEWLFEEANMIRFHYSVALGVSVEIN